MVFLSCLQMLLMMMMTSLIQAGLSGLTLRSTYSGGGGEGGGLGKGKYSVSLLLGVFDLGAAEHAKAV